MEGLVLSGQAIAVPLTETVLAIAPGTNSAVVVRTLGLVTGVLMMRGVKGTVHA